MYGIDSIESTIDSEGYEGGTFQLCSHLTEVIFPEGLESIGKDAFRYCTKLTQLKVPPTVKIIEYEAFLGCSDLGGINFANESRIQRIGKLAFSGCRELKNVNVAVKEIEKYAFQYCSKLIEVKLQEGLLTIGDGAFYKCVALNRVELPSTVKEIGEHAFLDCTNIEEVIFPKGLVKIGKASFCGCKGLRRIEVPSTVSELKKECFKAVPVLRK